MVSVTNLLNFRDLGGIATSCGKKVRAGRLLRAAQPVGLCDEDVKSLLALGLRFIVDFRTKNEATAEPVDEIAEVIYTHIDIMGDNHAHAANPKFWMELFHKNPRGVSDEFTQLYRDFVTNATSLAGYAAFLKAVAAADAGATLFHCAAGKDRTGFAAAILLKILGVPDEAIFDDYMQTKIYQQKVNDEYVERARKAGFSDEQIEEMGAIFGVKSDYLVAAFAAAEETYGSFENYVREGLGISDEEIERLKELYLE